MPTVTNDVNTRTNPVPRAAGPRGASIGVDAFMTWNATLTATAANESAQSAQASQAAMRVRIPPISCPCSLALSVTTPLYSTTVSRTLRAINFWTDFVHASVMYR